MRDIIAEHWLFSDLRAKPYLYLPYKSITIFSTYLSGYRAAQTVLIEDGEWITSEY